VLTRLLVLVDALLVFEEALLTVLRQHVRRRMNAAHFPRGYAFQLLDVNLLRPAPATAQ